MPDYSKACIYKLCCNDLSINDIYIGSTCNFTRRKNQHKSNCNKVDNNAYNYKVYQFIRDNGGFENWDMVLIKDKLNVENKQQLLKKEREQIELLKPTLNKSIPTRTQKQWIEQNKQHIKDKKKKYREDNKEQLKECNKQRYQDNKEIITQKRKLKYTCECGSIFRLVDKQRHLRSIKHTNYINSL